MRRFVSVILGVFVALTNVGAVCAQSFDLKVIDDVLGYFDRTYKGKQFSDVGVITEYTKSARLFSDYWYVQMKGANERSAYCVVAANESDPKLNETRNKFPVGTRIRLSGKMIEYVWDDQTVRLEDYCSLQKVN